MPRIRTIKPEFFLDDKIGTLSFEARLCFIGLWCLADDYGTINLHPLAIKGQLFPFDPDVDIDKCLADLEAQDLIIRYGPDKRYIYIRNFKKHQHINRPSKQRQAPPPEDFGIDPDAHETLTEYSVSHHGAISEHSPLEQEREKEQEREQGTGTGKENLRNANALRVLAARAASTTDAPPEPKKSKSSSKEPPKEQASSSDKLPSCPYQEIVKLYHEILPELPQCRVLNETRKNYIRTRWREIISKPELLAIFVSENGNNNLSTREKGLLWFKRYFQHVADSDFLTGKVPPSKGRNKPFIADLEWLMRPNNFAKVLEGRYHSRASPLDALSDAGRKTAMAAMELIREMQEEQDGVVH